MTSPVARFGCNSAACAYQRRASRHVCLTGYASASNSQSNKKESGAGCDKHYIVSVLCNTGCPALLVQQPVFSAHGLLAALRHMRQHGAPVDAAKADELLCMCLRPCHV